MSTFGSLIPRGRSGWSVTELLLVLTLTAAMLFGGSPNQPGWRILLILLFASALAAWSLTHGAARAIRGLPGPAKLFLALVPALFVAQLIPLPYALWAQLPGRGTAAEIFALVGTGNAAHPLSLTPRDTMFGLALLLPAAAMFLGSLTLDERGRERAVAVMLIIAYLSILLGLIQLTSRGERLQFYDTPHGHNLVGFFTNRNHESLLIVIAAVMTIYVLHRDLRNRDAALAMSAVASLVFMSAVIGTISRAGLLMVLLGLATIHAALFVRNWSRRRLLGLGIATAVVVALLLAANFTHSVQQALARFDSAGEYGRLELWERSWPLVTQYFPWGSGFGSFAPAYLAAEQLDDVYRRALNHTHNDYLELLIEGGIPAMAVVGALLWAVAARVHRMARGGWATSAFALPAAITIGLAAFHSTVDYPVRTTAISSILGMLLAFLLAHPKPARDAGRTRRSRASRR